jgi:hypothetical protein
MNMAAFLSYYERAHRNRANRFVHHVAHFVALVGLLLLWRPVLGCRSSPAGSSSRGRDTTFSSATRRHSSRRRPLAAWQHRCSRSFRLRLAVWPGLGRASCACSESVRWSRRSRALPVRPSRASSSGVRRPPATPACEWPFRAIRRLSAGPMISAATTLRASLGSSASPPIAGEPMIADRAPALGNFR